MEQLKPYTQVLAKATFDKAGVETAKLRMAGGKEGANRHQNTVKVHNG